MRLVNAQLLEHSNDVSGLFFQDIGSRIVGLIALAMASGIDEDEAIVLLKCIDVAENPPIFEAPVKPVQQDQRRTLAFDLIVNSHAVVFREAGEQFRRLRIQT